jgi:hypothetical protein
MLAWALFLVGNQGLCVPIHLIDHAVEAERVRQPWAVIGHLVNFTVGGIGHTWNFHSKLIYLVF